MSENGKAQAQAPEKKAAPSESRNDTAAFDWVTARSSCSLPKVFDALLRQIEGDVRTRNGLRPANSPYEFFFTEDNGELTVRLETQELSRSVAFSLSLPDHAIRVHDSEGNRKFDITARLDDAGECVLTVDGEDRAPWQVRRMALEDLMFSGS